MENEWFGNWRDVGMRAVSDVVPFAVYGVAAGAAHGDVLYVYLMLLCIALGCFVHSLVGDSFCMHAVGFLSVLDLVAFSAVICTSCVLPDYYIGGVLLCVFMVLGWRRLVEDGHWVGSSLLQLGLVWILVALIIAVTGMDSIPGHSGASLSLWISEKGWFAGTFVFTLMMIILRPVRGSSERLPYELVAVVAVFFLSSYTLSTPGVDATARALEFINGNVVDTEKSRIVRIFAFLGLSVSVFCSLIGKAPESVRAMEVEFVVLAIAWAGLLFLPLLKFSPYFLFPLFSLIIRVWRVMSVYKVFNRLLSIWSGYAPVQGNA